MTKKTDIDNLVSDLMEKPKAVSNDETPNFKKIVIPGDLIEDDDDLDKNLEHTFISSSTINGGVITGSNNTINNYFTESKKPYKRDTSASSLNREVIGYREVGEVVNVHNMTRNEYICYLGHNYDITNIHKWDGVERLYHRPNWTPDFSHNVHSYDEALEFIGIEKNDKAPDGLEKRHFERRQGLKDIRLDNTNR